MRVGEFDRAEAPAAIRVRTFAHLVSLELSRSTWLDHLSLSPGGGERRGRSIRFRLAISLACSDGLAQLGGESASADRPRFPEYRHPGGWSGRLDPPGAAVRRGSRATSSTPPRSRPSRPASAGRKTDRVDGETLVRTLMAFKREPRVCSMARAPTPQE